MNVKELASEIFKGITFLPRMIDHIWIDSPEKIILKVKKVEIIREKEGEEEREYLYIEMSGQSFLKIDLETRRLSDVGHSILGGSHRGSRYIGWTLITAIPSFFVSPWLLAKKVHYEKKEEERGMDCHAIVVFDAIKDQLQPATRKIVKRALQQSWREDKFLEQKISFKEAKKILSNCHLFEFREMNEDGSVHSSSFSWHDKNMRRTAREPQWHEKKGKDDEFELFVLGSSFVNNQARELTRFFKEKLTRSVCSNNGFDTKDGEKVDMPDQNCFEGTFRLYLTKDAPVFHKLWEKGTEGPIVFKNSVIYKRDPSKVSGDPGAVGIQTAVGEKEYIFELKISDVSKAVGFVSSHSFF